MTELPSLSTVVNLGAACAVILTVTLFLRHVARMQRVSREEREKERRESREEREKERKEAREEREAERRVLTDIIRQDLNQVGVGLARNVETLQAVTTSLREVHSALVRKNHIH